MGVTEKTAGWQLGVEEAEAYERYLVPLLFAPGAEALLGLAGLRDGERLLDVACGTGIVARGAAGRVGASGAVAGLDVNEGMLEVARGVSRGIRPEIVWRRGDAAEMPFADGVFDAVVCQQGLQFIRDRAGALAEMRRVLAPGGRAVISVLRSLGHNPGYRLFAEALERHAGARAGEMMRSPFPDLGSRALRDLLAGAGYSEVRIVIGIGPVRYPSAERMVRWEAASSPLAREILGLGGDAFGLLVRDVAETLEPYADDEGIVFPAETHVAVARA